MRFSILLAVILLASCSDKPEEGDLIGKYTVEYYGSVDTLVVNADGSYVHQFLNVERPFRIQGTWLLESVGREEIGVTFNAFAFRTKNLGLGPRGIWHTELEMKSQPQLCFIYDQDICFRKIIE